MTMAPSPALLVLVALTASACAAPTILPESVGRADTPSSTTQDIETLLNTCQWVRAAAEDRMPVTEQVGALRRRPEADLLTLFRHCHATVGRKLRDDERAVLNLARFLEGTWRAPKTEMRGVFLTEHMGVAWVNERAPEPMWLDKYETMRNPLVLPEPELRLRGIEPATAGALPRPRELLTELIEGRSPIHAGLEHGDASGLGLEIGLLARRDPELREWLANLARRPDLSAIVRDVLSVALATAAVREAEPLLRAWLLEVLQFRDDSQWTDKRQMTRLRALRVLAGQRAVAEVRREAEQTLPDHRRVELRAMSLDDGELEESLGAGGQSVDADGVARIAEVLNRHDCNREALSRETMLRCAERAIELAESWEGTPDAQHACDVAWLLIHPREGVAGRPQRVFEGKETEELRRRVRTIRHLLASGRAIPASGRRFALESMERDVLRWQDNVLLPPEPGTGERLWIQLWHPTWLVLDAARIEGGIELQMSNHGTSSLWLNRAAWEDLRSIRRVPPESADGPEWWEVRVGELFDRHEPRLGAAVVDAMEIAPGGEMKLPIAVPTAPADASIRVLYDDTMELVGLPAGRLLRRFAFEVCPHWVNEVQFE